MECGRATAILSTRVRACALRACALRAENRAAGKGGDESKESKDPSVAGTGDRRLVPKSREITEPYSVTSLTCNWERLSRGIGMHRGAGDFDCPKLCHSIGVLILNQLN